MYKFKFDLTFSFNAIVSLITDINGCTIILVTISFTNIVLSVRTRCSCRMPCKPYLFEYTFDDYRHVYIIVIVLYFDYQSNNTSPVIIKLINSMQVNVYDNKLSSVFIDIFVFMHLNTLWCIVFRYIIW